MFLLKKIVSRFLFPIPLCLEVLSIGLLLLWFTKRQKTGKTMATLAGVLLFLFASPVPSDMLLGPLESAYPPLDIRSEGRPSVGLSEAKFIVVLASGFSYDPGRPVALQLDDSSIARLLEGVRVSRGLSCCKLILSGGPGPNSISSAAEAMAEVAQGFGVGRQDMILDTRSRNTEDQARLVAPIVGKQPFILVTEASHMPRSMALFRKQGTRPIADPVDFRASDGRVALPDEVLPDAEVLRGSQRAVYEYLGLAWAKIRGKI